MLDGVNKRISDCLVIPSIVFLFGDSKVKWSLSAHKFDKPAQEVISHGGKEGNGCEMVGLGLIFRVPEMCHLTYL